jgi:hypothetical protein
LVAVRIILGLAFVALGVWMIWHALKRHRGWGRVSDVPLPWWQSFLSYRLPRETVTERDLEQEGTVVEGVVGVAVFLVGFLLWYFRTG